MISADGLVGPCRQYDCRVWREPGVPPEELREGSEPHDKCSHRLRRTDIDVFDVEEKLSLAERTLEDRMID